MLKCINKVIQAEIMGDNSHLVGMLQAEKTPDFFLEDTDKVTSEGQ